MTLATDPMFAPMPLMRPAIAVAHKLDGTRLVIRLGQRLASASLALVALLVWLAPGATWESDIMLFKLLVSATSVLASVGLWQSSLPPLPPTIEVDVANAEVRLVREDTPEGRSILERCAFDDLHMAELAGRHITLWGQGGRMLAEFTLSNATAHATLLAALRGAGKLAV